MKPVTSNSSGAENTTTTTSSCPNLEPVSVNSKSDYNKALTNHLGNKIDTNMELDWKSSSTVAVAAAEQTIEGK